jgi:SAM-dependent methyltransferase
MKVCLVCGQRFEADDWLCPGCGNFPELHNGYLAFSPDLAETNDGFDAEYFGVLARLEARSFWFKSRNRLLIWALRRYFPHASSFLEIGCGTGFVLSGIQREFPELTLSGSEIFSEGLALAEKRLHGVALFQMDACHIPFEAEYDVIGAFDVLEHIEEDGTALLQMYEASKTGGGILLTTPQHRFLWSVLDDYSFHKRRYTRKELLEKVERAGFTILRASSFVSLLLPLMMLSRMKQRSMQADFDPLAEYKSGPILNTVLEKVLAIERMAIQRGISFPAGGSLLVVARK